MNMYKVLLTISILLVSFHLQAQIHEYGPIKSLEYRCYKIKQYENNVVKNKKATILFEGYPIHYPVSKRFFNKDGQLIKENRYHQRDTSYYNSANNS